jgi:AraC-like DNA-binding protein
MPAYKGEAIDHGKIAFFDCGGNMGATYCPHCRTEMNAPVWSDWMTDDYGEAKGFTFSNNLKAIAPKVGYGSTEALIRTFLRYSKQTPKEWLKSQSIYLSVPTPLSTIDNTT